MFRLDQVALGHPVTDRGDASELAHIAGPAVFLEDALGMHTELAGDAVLPAEPVEEDIHQQFPIIPALAEGRNFEREIAKPKVEVLAKLVRVNHVANRAIGGGDDTECVRTVAPSREV